MSESKKSEESVSVKSCEVCVWVKGVSTDVMQSISDIFGQGTQIISPFLKGALDIMTIGVSGGNGKAQKEVVKKAKEMSPVKNCVAKNTLPFNRHFVRFAGISGAVAVGLGAYGAHVLMMDDKIPEDRKHSFRTANMYHFIGTFGLVASSLARFPMLSGVLMAIGTTVFCGACYYHGLTGDPSVKQFAPYGGTTLIAAWLSLVL